MIPAANPSTPPAIAQRNDAIVRRVRAAVRRGVTRFACALRGHDYRVIFAGRRIYQQCDSCDRERPAIDLDRPEPRRRS